MPNDYSTMTNADLDAEVARKLGWKWWKVTQGEPYQLRMVGSEKDTTVWAQDIVPAYCREDFIKQKCEAYRWKYEPSEPPTEYTSLAIKEPVPKFSTDMNAAMGLVKDWEQLHFNLVVCGLSTFARQDRNSQPVEVFTKDGEFARGICLAFLLAHDAKGTA